MHHFKVLNSALFEPDAKWLHTAPYIAQIHWVRKCVQNPTKEDELRGIYKPRLTFLRRWNGTEWVFTLKIEFSIPKLLFGNNFDELSDDDFKKVVKVLSNKLLDMGIQVLEGKLEQSVVSTIHYWKNIVLDDFTSVSRILSLVAKTNISERFDTGDVDYINGWKLLRFHTKSFQIVLYDKIADLNKSEDRAVEKDMRRINYQISLFQDMQKKEVQQKNKAFEVLRIEIRFMNKTKLKTLFRTLNIPFEDVFTFESAFRMNNARKIIEHHWNLIVIDLMTLEFTEMKPIDRMNLIFRKASNKTPTKTLAVAMLAELIANDDYRTIRNQFESKFKNKNSLRMLRKELVSLELTANHFSFIPIINEALKIYKPLQIKNYM